MDTAADFIAEEPVKALPGSGAYLQQLEEQRALKVGHETNSGLALNSSYSHTNTHHVHTTWPRVLNRQTMWVTPTHELVVGISSTECGINFVQCGILCSRAEPAPYSD